MMKPFSESSYLTQVRRLRLLAEAALKKFPLKVQKITFINHGENTTFKVDTKSGASYLIRIHRSGYHTRQAIEEELNWLSKLGQDKTLSVPRPIRSKSGRRLEEIQLDSVGSRYVCVFKWLSGRFIEKSLNEKHMFQLGQLIGKFHQRPPKTKHRIYWTAEGLVGKNAKFGSLTQLNSVTSRQRKKLIRVSQKIFKKLQAYEKKYPHRLGLIHADLHFRNLLLVDQKLGAIDFDDCGYGFFAYDLLIPLVSAKHILGKKRKKKLPLLKRALLNGYKTLRSWDEDDDEILNFLHTARSLTMLAWLNSRSDNPKLKKFMKKAVKLTLQHIQTADHLKNRISKT